MSKHILLCSKDLSSDVDLASVKRHMINRVNNLFDIFWKEHEALKGYSVLDEQLTLFDAGAVRCVSERDFMYYQRLSMLRCKLGYVREILWLMEYVGLISVSKHHEIIKFLDVAMNELE